MGPFSGTQDTNTAQSLDDYTDALLKQQLSKKKSREDTMYNDSFRDASKPLPSGRPEHNLDEITSKFFDLMYKQGRLDIDSITQYKGGLAKMPTELAAELVRYVRDVDPTVQFAFRPNDKKFDLYSRTKSGALVKVDKGENSILSNLLNSSLGASNLTPEQLNSTLLSFEKSVSGNTSETSYDGNSVGSMANQASGAEALSNDHQIMSAMKNKLLQELQGPQNIYGGVNPNFQSPIDANIKGNLQQRLMDDYFAGTKAARTNDAMAIATAGKLSQFQQMVEMLKAKKGSAPSSGGGY